MEQNSQQKLNNDMSRLDAPKPARQEDETPRSIGGEIDVFLAQIDALAETLPLTTSAINNARAAAGREFNKFLQEECKTEKNTEKKTVYRYTGSQAPKFQRFQRRVQKPELAQILVPRGLFVAMISQFDAFLGALIRHMFQLQPGLLDSSERVLTLSQLSQFRTIAAAKEFIIEKEIESVLRDSHVEQFEWLEKKLNMPLRKQLPIWKVFVEITERRNLFVHTNGVVSRQYLHVCNTHSCAIPETATLGTSLPLTREYFTSAYECLLEIGVKLGQVLWRKLQPDELQDADANLSNVAYSLLFEGRYQLARVLLDFATQILPRHSSENARLRFVVNRAQAYKWTGEEENCRTILDAEDWTATDPKFRLAYAVLCDDFENAIEIVRQLGTSKDQEMDEHTYRDWPLFREFRKHPDFVSLFEQVFGEPLNRFVVEGPLPDKIN